ncbi:Multidrug resistance-associated protein 1 [Hypsibius exemplaris]|uniref:ABC-type glutathione-S-conjugate transporter n=1 Tax=Hypsibius exemplaris TaxID=2072580 RepID=A0A1W0W860_HYPEX|nr:Multidrug resistance-associated protein 1 [Hypsibius exemplaris]
MSAFCLSPFWDDRKTWSTDDPDFTYCFEKTVLIWIPAVFLWFVAPFKLCFICRKSDQKSPAGQRLFWTKVTLTIVLAAITCAELGYSSNELINLRSGSLNLTTMNPHEHVIQYADIAAAAVRLLTYALFVGYLYFGDLKGKRSSGTLFVYWILASITEGIRFRSAIKDIVSHEGLSVPVDRFRFFLEVLQFILIIAQLSLSVISTGRKIEPTSSKTPSPEEHAPFLSQVLFWWFNSLVYLGWKRSLRTQDIWDLNTGEKSRTISKAFFKRWDKRKQDLALGHVLFRAFWPELVYSALLKLLFNVMLFSTPAILGLLMKFVKNRSQEVWKGYLFAALLLVASVVQTSAMGHYFHQCNKLGIRLRTAVMCGVYRKVIRVAAFADANEKLESPTNLISVDAQRLMDLSSYVNQIWEIPLQIGVAMYFLWTTLGPSSLAGLGVMILSMPVEALIAFYSKKMQVRQMQAKDARIRLTGEVFRTIKLLKLYAWDEAYEKRILVHRDAELESLRTIAFLTAFSTFYSMVSPFIIALATFATFVLSDSQNVLDSSKAFVALAYFNILKSPMNMLPPTIMAIVQAVVSKTRLVAALVSHEPKTYVEGNNWQDLGKNLRDYRPAVAISHGKFSWSKSGTSCLKNITMTVPSGKLIGIVGTAGSGKSALCRAILGLMDHRGGTVKTGGSIAYMPQQSWLQNRTFKENVLFGRPFHRMSYQTTLEECALIDDLSSMPAGEDTQLSDDGANLSGGQKQRICLARTVYGYADIFVMDDPLSALDAKVGKHIFEKVLGPNSILKEKTRIVVVNGYQFLPHFDQLIVLDDGEITEVGTFPQLLSQGGPFSELLHNHLRQEIEDLHTSELEDSEAAHRHTVFKEIVQKLPHVMRASLRQHRKSIVSQREKRRRSSAVSKIGSLDELQHKRLRELNGRLLSTSESSGTRNSRRASTITSTVGVHGGRTPANGEATDGNRAFNWRIYWSFMRSFTIKLTVIIFLTSTVSTAFSVASNIWLSKWAEDNLTMPDGSLNVGQRDFRLGIYAALGGLQGVFFFISMISLAYGLILSSKVLHSKLLHHLIRAPTYFFDITPLGRITNRFSKDVDAVDVNVPQSIRQCLNAIFNIFATLTVLIYAYPLFTAFMVPIAIVYILLLYFYISTSRQLKQLESVSRSPIFSHFQETLSGAALINIFGQHQRFTNEFERCLDNNNQIAYFSLVAQRWLSLRLELIGNIIAFTAALLAVYGRDHWNVLPGTVGLTITYSVQVTQVLSWFVQKLSDLEMSFISVERIKEYTKCPQEAKRIIPEELPPADWPSNGSIKFVDYTIRYRPDLDFALKGLTCEIKAREKIGIVGRTGAGKSSLSLGIFRIVEAAEGSIIIDNVDIAKLGLEDLRSRITIIPQEPFLLSGTLRENLDPTNVSTDDAIWEALDAAHLRRYVLNLKDGLLHLVEEGGRNFSAGQRQMLCLARAIIRKPRILIMDEATASLDAETDELLQKSIRTEFVDCTVLIIAHRLQSVMDCNRVMVLDKGQIKEFDSPQALLSNKDSVFYSLAEDANMLDHHELPSGDSEDSLESPADGEESPPTASEVSTTVCPNSAITNSSVMNADRPSHPGTEREVCAPIHKITSASTSPSLSSEDDISPGFVEPFHREKN